MPLPLSRNTVLLCVPAGMLNDAFPSKVGISISPPTAAMVKGSGTLACRSSFSLVNVLCGLTCTTMYRSPGAAPRTPASPPPLTLRLVPFSAPAGILTSSLRVFFTPPVPSHSPHSSVMILPSPLHFLHVVVVWKMPNGVLCVRMAMPLPSHSGHVSTASGEAAPEPLHGAHCSSRGMETYFVIPEAASSRER